MVQLPLKFKEERKVEESLHMQPIQGGHQRTVGNAAGGKRTAAAGTKHIITAITSPEFAEQAADAREGELKNYKEKVVKCRKPHECMGCDRGIKAGEKAVYESGFLDGKPVSYYTCLECIENWLEESGQVESGD